MKAIIPAAGFATRLYPLTQEKAKALLPVAGRPIIDYLVEKINALPDIDMIYVVANDRFYPQFIEWSVQAESKIPIIILNNHVQNNEDRLGAVGDMHYAIEKAKIDDHVLVTAGDNLFEFDLRNLLRGFYMNGCSHVAALDLQDKSKVAKRFGVLEINENNRIIGFEEKPSAPKTSLAATFLYVLNRSDVQFLKTYVAEGGLTDNAGDFIANLAQQRQVFAYMFTEPWYDIGTLEHYKEVNALYEGVEHKL